MVTNSHLLITCKPPRKIIPVLIEWWLDQRKRYKDYACAEIFQIESVNEANPFYYSTRVFTGDKTPSMIISANTKTLVYYPENEEGNPVIDPTTHRPIQKTIHCPDILIYRCLPLSTIKNFEESGNSDILGKRI